MLSLPDLKEKKIVFIPVEEKLENQLKFRNSNICLYREGKLVNKVSAHIVLSIYLIGEFTLTSQLIQNARKHGISIFMLNSSFDCYARIMSEADGNTELRKFQYNLSNLTELQYAQMIVRNKIENQYTILKKAGLSPDKNQYFMTLKSVDSITSQDSLRGIEGNYSSIYFGSLFNSLGWVRRAPRTKEDIPNLLLDIGYTFMFNFVDSLLLLFGFDTYKGFYHKLFFQRQSLTCDLIEPLRPLVDYQLLKSYNLGQINEKDFRFKNHGFSIKSWDLQKKYTKIWFELVMSNREQIYNYILGYYRYTQNSTKYSKPQFKIA